MPTFIATWNGQKREVTLPPETRLKDLKSQVQNEFGLSTCKLVGLKRKTKANAQENEDDSELSAFILQNMQKVLVIGSRNTIEKEDTKMVEQEESFEEEVGYETIVNTQQTQIANKLRQLHAPRDMHFKVNRTALETLCLAKALCYDGDVTTLKKLWEVDANTIKHPGEADLCESVLCINTIVSIKNLIAVQLIQIHFRHALLLIVLVMSR